MDITLLNLQKGTTQNLSLEALASKMRQGNYLTLIEKKQNWMWNGQYTPRPKYVNQIPLFCLGQTDDKGKLTHYNGLIHLYMRHIESAEEIERPDRSTPLHAHCSPTGDCHSPACISSAGTPSPEALPTVRNCRPTNKPPSVPRTRLQRCRAAG